jgi:hypothetical protein
MRKMAVYLGLVEDDHRFQEKYDSYGEYEEYDGQADRPEQPDEPDVRRLAHRARVPDDRSRPYHDTASSHLQ